MCKLPTAETCQVVKHRHKGLKAPLKCADPYIPGSIDRNVMPEKVWRLHCILQVIVQLAGVIIPTATAHA